MRRLILGLFLLVLLPALCAAAMAKQPMPRKYPGFFVS